MSEAADGRRRSEWQLLTTAISNAFSKNPVDPFATRAQAKPKALNRKLSLDVLASAVIK